MSYAIAESNFIILANKTMNSTKKEQSLHVQKFIFIGVARGKWQDVRMQHNSKTG